MARSEAMSFPDLELFEALRQVVAALDQLKIDYFVGGSVASGLLGEPRQTLDADLVAALLGRHAAPLAALLQSEFYVDLPAILTATERQSCFNLIHLETMVKVDVFVAARSDFARSEFSRRVRTTVNPDQPLELFFASAEDIVLAKLDWFRKGGEVSDRQWRDILGVMKVQATSLDHVYLREWADRLGVGSLLARAVSDARLPSGPA
jgi:hypothetical protein